MQGQIPSIEQLRAMREIQNRNIEITQEMLGVLADMKNWLPELVGHMGTWFQMPDTESMTASTRHWIHLRQTVDIAAAASMRQELQQLDELIAQLERRVIPGSIIV